MLTKGTSTELLRCCAPELEGPGGPKPLQNTGRVLAKLLSAVAVVQTRAGEEMGSCWPLEKNVSA